MTAVLQFTVLLFVLQNLWSGGFPSGNVYASNCEHDGKSFTQQLLELHNASMKAAKTFGKKRNCAFCGTLRWF
ncbi:hypothetical protein MRX96_048014, partial [Rhipicephalus microplus]